MSIAYQSIAEQMLAVLEGDGADIGAVTQRLYKAHKLLTVHVALFRQRGLAAVQLYTNEMMADNLLIYPRLGYVKVAQRTEDGFKRVYFEKPL